MVRLSFVASLEDECNGHERYAADRFVVACPNGKRTNSVRKSVACSVACGHASMSTLTKIMDVDFPRREN